MYSPGSLWLTLSLSILTLSTACGGPEPEADGDADADGEPDGDAEDAEAEDADRADADTEDAEDADADFAPGLLGRITFDRRPITPRGLGGSVAEPGAGLSVRLLDGEEELARAVTDADGRYRLELPEQALAGAALRVVATAEGDRELEVTDHLTAIYSVVTEPFSLPETRQVDLELDEAANAGAFAIFDTLRAGLEAAESALERETPLPRLRARWERGRETPLGTSYAEGDNLWILGGPEDTDEYDEPVLLHELGHFIQVVYPSSTSVMGDPHAGASTDPRLAFREGWASFFAGLASESPLYLDTVGGELWFSVDLSALPEWGEFLADPSEGMTQTLSEWVVAGALWRLLTASDELLLQRRRSLAVISLWFGLTPPPDRGVSGYDLVDFLDGYLCLHDGADEEVIEGYLVEERGFPYDLTPNCQELAARATPRCPRPAHGCAGKPGRPPLPEPRTLAPDGVFRGRLVRTAAGETLRETRVPLRAARSTL